MNLKNITFFLFVLISGFVLSICFCTTRVRSSQMSPQPQVSNSTPSIKTAPPQQSTSATFISKTPHPLTSDKTPSQWQGETFVVLPKQKLISSSGYQLNSCKKNECDSLPIESTWELDNRRIRCENIAGDPLYVEAVEPDGHEWLVTFYHAKSNKYLYGRTHKQAISEIAFVDDRVNAYSRWMDKTIFSKRGIISTFGTNSNASLTSLRINIQDSLTVTDVVWGMTPLPVKPIWIMVTTKSGKSGFIPIRYSWTNTMTDLITEEAPWEEDIFERNPTMIYDWDENIWGLINNHRVILEMTPDQIQLSWGKPLAVKIKNDGQTKQIMWTYASHELIFVENRLSVINTIPFQNP